MNGLDPYTVTSTMAPMISEPAIAQSRRQAFVATCSPDELLGQVIQTLCPTYNIDAPHLLALRQLISSTIVPPRVPPTLKRTRPDKRIGEIESIYETSCHSLYGPNGPPISASQSFYFHHDDADFNRLLPRVDRSRYEKKSEPAHESTQSGSSVVLSLAPKCDVLMLSAISVQNASDGCTEAIAKTATEPMPQALEPRPVETSGPASGDATLYSTQSLIEVPHQDASANSQASEQLAAPAISSTSHKSTIIRANDEVVLRDLVPSLIIAATVTVKPQDMQDMHIVPLQPYTFKPKPLDTQDTVDSTQLSEVFSPSDDFVHFTPPTQEETLGEELLQDDSINTYTRTKASGTDELIEQLPRQSCRSLSSGSSTAADMLGKRSRRKSDAVDGAPSFKRSKSEEASQITSDIFPHLRRSHLAA